MKRKVSLLIADQEPVVRFGITEFLRRRDQWRVCGHADSAPATRALCEREKPDVLVLDPALSAGEGFSLIKEAANWSKEVRVVVFSILEDADSMVRAFRAGAAAYVTRTESLEQLTLAIDAALAGREFMGTQVQRVLFSQMRAGRMEVSSSSTGALSLRERQIFQLLGQGWRKQEIAQELHLSCKTVDTHQQRIKDKLNVASCAELRKRATTDFHRFASEPRDWPSTNGALSV